jgi:hypothetical protein
MTGRLLWRPGLTEDNVRRIRPGMTLAEVEALLGGPATVTVDMHSVVGNLPAEECGCRRLRVWKDANSRARVEVQFTREEGVMAAAGQGRPQPGPLASLRSLLGW